MNQSDEIAQLREDLEKLTEEVSKLREFRSWVLGGMGMIGALGLLLADKFRKIMGLG